MIRSLLGMLLVSTAVSTQAFAIYAPPPGREDAHIRSEPYSAMNRTMIIGTVGRVTNITFNPLERIKRVVMGQDNSPMAPPSPDKNSSPLQNNLMLTGMAVGTTDMLVITLLPDGTERPYQFFIDVRAKSKDGGEDPDATFGLVFTYPKEEQAAKAAAWQEAAPTRKQKAEAERQQVAEARLSTDATYGTRNWHYCAQGTDTLLAPYEVWDNGRITALRYPGNTEMPTVYIVDSTGAERTAQVNTQDDLLLIHQVAQHIRLRLGEKRVLEIYNKSYDPVGANPGTGTGSPDVVRRVVSSQ